MFVFPVASSATLPDEFVEHAQIADDPFILDPAQVEAQRNAWTDRWVEIVPALTPTRIVAAVSEAGRCGGFELAGRLVRCAWMESLRPLSRGQRAARHAEPAA